MANKKLSDVSIKTMLLMFDNGKSPADLAKIFKVSASTISRYLKEFGRVVKLRESHRVLIDDTIKTKLRRLLSGYGISCPDILISDLDKHFIIEIREEEETEVIYV